MNGLTMSDVNTPINDKYICSGLRFTTYESLWLTGSKRIENFDIDRCIVIKDLENELHYQALEVDAPNNYVSEDLQDVTHIAEITDGAGMFLPGVFQHTDKKNHTKDITAFTARAPWFKGLMVQHDFMAAAKRTNNYIIKDAWGQDHNIFLEGINCIWTTSQLKLWKAYKSWDHYKRYFKELDQYFCMALVPEEKDKLILSYQPLQDLRGSQQQIRNLLKNQFNKLWKDYGRVDNRTSENPTDWLYNYENTLKDIGLYQLPIFKEVKAMLNCRWVKCKVRDYLRNEFKKMKYGKIRINGIEPFISPDWNWVCNKLFGDNAPEVPTNYICCKTLNIDEEVDIVRYPHLYTGAHCIRKNVRVEGLNSDCVYVDANGITALLCEADYDGDHLQLFRDKAYLDIVKNDENNRPPIHYLCSGGKKYPVTFDYSEHGVYQELRNSYGDNANVGIPSNLATRIFNDEDYEWNKIYRYVAMLAHMIQGAIDFPKAGVTYKLQKDIIDEIKESAKPHYMIYAKELEDNKRLDALNRKEMIKITREMFGAEMYPEQLSEEQFKEMLLEYKEQRTKYFDFVNYGDSMIVKILNRIKEKYKDNKDVIRRIEKLMKYKRKFESQSWSIKDLCSLINSKDIKSVKDLIDHLYSEEDQEKRIRVMDFVEVLCMEEEQNMEIENWYAPFEMFKSKDEDRANTDYNLVDSDDDIDYAINCITESGEEFDIPTDKNLPEGFTSFIQEFDNKFTHPDYSTRINSQTMFNPISEIQMQAKREFHEKFKMKLYYKNGSTRNCLFKQILAHPDGTGFAFCQYVWPDELLEYARHYPVVPAISPKAKKQKAGEEFGYLGKDFGESGKQYGDLGGEIVAIPIRMISEDNKIIIDYNSLQECSNSIGIGKNNISTYSKDGGKFHKIKSLGYKCKFERINNNED